MGSHQGNAHVHWHLVPLPPGTPYADQQFNAVMLERAGYVELAAEDEAALCVALRETLKTAKATDGLDPVDRLPDRRPRRSDPE